MVRTSPAGSLESYKKMSDGIAAAAAQSGLSFIPNNEIISKENQEIAAIIDKYIETHTLSPADRSKLDYFNYSMKA